MASVQITNHQISFDVMKEIKDGNSGKLFMEALIKFIQFHYLPIFI